MQTKIGALSERVLEAGWLVALITVPLFFNLYSMRIYEPDKITFLRSVAVFMIAVWLIRLIEQGNAADAPEESWVLAFVKKTPLLLPTLLLAGVYLLATLTSVVPRTSFWGSYQRLQGTYTTLSYLVIFAIMLQTLRTRAQLDRLVTVSILSSVPVAFYAILQHYGLDPLPWIGNVQARSAANMGNSIFVAAYFIMISPLTWARAFDAFAALLLEEEGGMADVVRGAIYVFVAALQFIAIYWSGSRGPQLGFMAGALFFLLVLGFVRRWRWLVWGTVGLGLIGVAFLTVLNLPNSPLEPLKANPYIGRLGRIFVTDSGTGKVRVLIWQGAVDLITPHEPLLYPDGDPDRLNFARPLVGYGPESMWVAYNRFYPPELAQVEARNASPDRSHNETFDALIITGLVGFVVYMLVFASLFYYGFKWLGLIRGKKERNLFAGLWVFGGTVGAIVAGLARVEFVGVGLPLGIIVGVGLYLLLVTTFLRDEIEPPADRWYQLLLIGLISAVLAHFVEIHFAIAIAATRIYFWTYAALLVVLGYLMRGEAVPAETLQPAAQMEGARGSRRSRRRRRVKQAVGSPGSSGAGRPAWVGPVLVASLLVSFTFVVLVYDFVTNQARETAIGDIIWHSLTTKLVRGQMVPTYGVIGMFVLVWWVGGALFIAEMIKAGRFEGEPRDAWAKAFLLYLPFPPLIGLLYAVVHVSWLRRPLLQQSGLTVIQQVNMVAAVLVVFYVMAFLMVLAMGFWLYWQDKGPKPRRFGRDALSWMHVPILIVAVLVIWLTNINVIRADIIFKQGESTDRAKMWQASVQIYNHALDLAPNEDHYYLFLGRAYLEWAKDSDLEPAQRFAVLDECRKALEKAQNLNPLNTDHSANLARLYSSWAAYTTNAEERTNRVNQSIQYYEQATTLSPNNAQLHNEWAALYMTYGQFDKALAKYEQSLSLDPEFDMSYFGLGDLYYNTQQLELAAEMYEKGLTCKTTNNTARRQAENLLGVIYAQLGRNEEAVEAILRVLEERPDDFEALKNLALLYRDTDQVAQAIVFAQQAAQARPNYAAIHQLLGELYRAAGDPVSAQQAYQNAVDLSPEDVNSLWGLAMSHWDQGQHQEAIVQLEAALELVPDNLQVIQALGDLYVRVGNWEKAIEAYETVLAASPELVQVRSALAQAYSQAGRLEEAVAQTLQVLQVAPDDYVSHKNLALLYQRLGRIDQALSEAEAALELAPEGERAAISDLIAELRQAQGS